MEKEIRRNFWNMKKIEKDANLVGWELILLNLFFAAIIEHLFGGFLWAFLLGFFLIRIGFKYTFFKKSFSIIFSFIWAYIAFQIGEYIAFEWAKSFGPSFNSKSLPYFLAIVVFIYTFSKRKNGFKYSE